MAEPLFQAATALAGKRDESVGQVIRNALASEIRRDHAKAKLRRPQANSKASQETATGCAGTGSPHQATR